MAPLVLAPPSPTGLAFDAEWLLEPPPTVRAAGPRDVGFLSAVAPVADGAARDLTGWGRHGDAGVIAFKTAGVPVGAAWYRLYAPAERGDGIVAQAGLPELALAVRPDVRGQEVAGALLAALIRRARAEGYRRLALTLDPAHPALAFFRHYRFRETAVGPRLGDARLMIAEIARFDPVGGAGGGAAVAPPQND
ncbi:MAG: GNAT family N-acetyltransferase [Candidatus Rokubacteria bacterium]|nr:GNAT family N-acetyltransferase [Candidatus Rokubacteria bacterium]